jgi:ribonuclease HII
MNHALNSISWDNEAEYIPQVVCGVDEAGRGPLAGGVFAAAVILPFGLEIPYLNDSKKLSPKRRDTLYELIKREALSVSCAIATVEEIEELNILNASMLAMKRAVEGLTLSPSLALVDGNCIRGFTLPAKCVIGGDALCPSIAAASIIAKVERDRHMLELDREYPQYGFSSHKGYGTKAHMDALREHGLSPHHRPSFIHI